MAFTITTGIPVTAKEAFLRGEFLAAHTYKVGLFEPNADLTQNYGPTLSSTVDYADITTGTDEQDGTGYTPAGGKTLATYASGPNNATPTVITGTKAWIDWTTNPEWSAASFTTAGMFVYDDSHANKLILFVIDFGGDKTVTSGTFTIQLPDAAAATAIFRLE